MEAEVHKEDLDHVVNKVKSDLLELLVLEVFLV